MAESTESLTESTGFDYVFFDCDSTLSSIEGIDELARMKGKFNEVKALTDAAMDGEVYLDSVYDRRLEMLAPTHEEVVRIDDLYRKTMVRHADVVIAALQFAGKEVFIVSGGLLAAVRPFGRWLGVPHDHIRAVTLEYDELSGDWWDYLQDQWDQRTDVEYKDSEETPLVHSEGKSHVVEEMLGDRRGQSLLIGDGVSDLAASDVVDLFVGFTGVVARPHVVAESEVLVTGDSLAPVLGLALTESEQNALSGSVYGHVLEESLARSQAGEVLVRKG
ncbi:MAG: HAD-IB family phosphatase [Acidimicrobiia bacterium]|nr:HAD-IB family phosphatase [Acidimicrobiia bacterium]MDX2466847.1 HAD-IB family phosphatase [Acidimicrobiia bacterium]